MVRITTGEADPMTGKRPKTFRFLHHDDQGWTATAPPKPWPLYRLPDLAAARSIVVCEGEQTTDALRAVGITATTSPCGAGKAAYADWLPLAGKRVVVWPDHDAAGAAHADEIVALLRSLPTPPEMIGRVDPTRLGVPMPAKGDAVDFLAAIGGDAQSQRDAVIAVLKESPSVGNPSPVAQLLASIEDEASGKSSLIALPWPMLSRLSRALLPGKVVILAGAPGGAKSWMVLQTMLDLTQRGVSAAMLALEEPWTWHGKRALAQLEGRPSLLDSEWIRANPDDAREAAARHGDALDNLGHAYTCKGNLSLDACAAWVEQRAKAGARVLIIDPITLADNGAAKPWEADRNFMARAKVAAEAHGLSLVLVTHPRKAGGTLKPAPPGLDDLAGGAAYQRAAASVLWLSSLPAPLAKTVRTVDGKDALADLHKTIRLLKTRDGTGVGSTVGFQFRGLRFHEMGAVHGDA
mgnify:CR=1 FL=1